MEPRATRRKTADSEIPSLCATVDVSHQPSNIRFLLTVAIPTVDPDVVTDERRAPKGSNGEPRPYDQRNPKADDRDSTRYVPPNASFAETRRLPISNQSTQCQHRRLPFPGRRSGARLGAPTGVSTTFAFRTATPGTVYPSGRVSGRVLGVAHRFRSATRPGARPPTRAREKGTRVGTLLRPSQSVKPLRNPEREKGRGCRRVGPRRAFFPLRSWRGAPRPECRSAVRRPEQMRRRPADTRRSAAAEPAARTNSFPPRSVCYVCPSLCGVAPELLLVWLAGRGPGAELGARPGAAGPEAGTSASPGIARGWLSSRLLRRRAPGPARGDGRVRCRLRESPRLPKSAHGQIHSLELAR